MITYRGMFSASAIMMGVAAFVHLLNDSVDLTFGLHALSAVMFAIVAYGGKKNG